MIALGVAERHKDNVWVGKEEGSAKGEGYRCVRGLQGNADPRCDAPIELLHARARGFGLCLRGHNAHIVLLLHVWRAVVGRRRRCSAYVVGEPATTSPTVAEPRSRALAACS